MPRTGTAAFAVILSVALCACVSTSSDSVGPPTGAPLRDGAAVLMIPGAPAAQGRPMRATLASPAGAGPHRLAIVAHGSEQDPARRAAMPMPSFPALTEWLVARGFAVLTFQRPGHGATGGRYLEDQGACGNADYVRAGNGAADSIAAALDYMIMQPNILPSGVLIVGNSAGGLGAVALAARNPEGVSGVVAFSAGRGGRDRDRAGQNCSPERLVAAAAEFGRTARIPTLWLYAENDTYFPPELSGRIAAAYGDAGAPSEYVLLPPVGSEGHVLIDAPGPPPPWASDLDRFLSRAR